MKKTKEFLNVESQSLKMSISINILAFILYLFKWAESEYREMFTTIPANKENKTSRKGWIQGSQEETAVLTTRLLPRLSSSTWNYPEFSKEIEKDVASFTSEKWLIIWWRGFLSLSCPVMIGGEWGMIISKHLSQGIM